MKLSGTSQRRLLDAVEALRPGLEQLALEIHADPETAWQEQRTTERLTSWLKDHDIVVEQPFCGFETAFRARHVFSKDGPVVTLIAEYDALPELGHACGHNLICTAAVGALVALDSGLSDTEPRGTVQVIGTPAEEGGGGKLRLIEAGAFQDSDVAMMVHPFARTMVVRPSLAATHLSFVFHGQASHAATSPQLGVNALDACILTFNAINAMRQHILDESRIHGIITHGGTAANVVPDHAEAEFMVRHKRSEYALELRDKVVACARGASAAVGATVDVHEGHLYAERKNNVTLATRFGSHLEELGEQIMPPPEIGGVGSSDFNNLSQLVPAIHPYIAIAPEGTSNHTRAFARAAASAAGLRGMVLGAKALALTAAELLIDADFLESVVQEFARA
jgi:amidohydrolase